MEEEIIWIKKFKKMIFLFFKFKHKWIMNKKLLISIMNQIINILFIVREIRAVVNIIRIIQLKKVVLWA